MSFIEEHFDAEVTIVGGIIAAIWGLIRLVDTKDKTHLKEWLERLEESITEIKSDLKEINENLVCREDLEKVDAQITELQKAVNLARERAVSVERINQLSGNFEGVKESIQKIRHGLIASLEKEKNAERRIDSLEKQLAEKVDTKMCGLRHNIERNQK